MSHLKKRSKHTIGSHEQNKEMNELRKLFMMNALIGDMDPLDKKKQVLVFVR